MNRHPCIEIPLTRGLVALVDPEDASTIQQFSWHAKASNRTSYARRGIWIPSERRTRQQCMHTLLTGWPYVDHVNGNGLDNRRTNLRPANDSQNQGNRRKALGRSRFKGVSRYSRDETWKSTICRGGRQTHLGYFASEEEAAMVYDAAARQHFGEFAALNFPHPGERSALDVAGAAT